MANPQAALDQALDEKTLVLIYQPIHSCKTGAIIAAEALLRQRRESGEIREAGMITAAAEEGPELFRLDSWVVREAYRNAAQWQNNGAPGIRLNVNLSPREFQEGAVLARLETLLSSSRIDPYNVDLEITETSYIDSPEETMHVLEALKELGIRLWLDDFGTGHSSLEHVQHFPLAGVKIAAQFIAGCITDARCRAITKSIIQMAHEIGLAVIAEGVEKQEQLDYLCELGCEAVQGFLLNKPMTLEEFLTLVRFETVAG